MLISLAFFLLVHSFIEGALSYRMVCVYTNWSQYRPDKGKFLPENIDPTMCTHLIYVYAKLQGNRLEPSEWNDESTAWMEGMYSRVNNLKQVNPDLKTLLGVGGWKMGSKNFSRMASTKLSRERFARTAIEFLRERDFDGLAIDWQYPTQRGGRKRDKKNFSLLLKELRHAFKAESTETGFEQLLLVAGVAANKQVIEGAYEAEKVSNYTDFLNIMAYDLHGSWDNFTGHPSPLYARKDETGPQAKNNVDALMKYWVSKGADPGKLVLGVSTYGRTFTLRNKRHHDYGVPSIGPGDAGDYTKQAGMLAFYERCSLYFDATRVWDSYSKVPHWYSGRQWIGGEDTESVRAKVNWIHSNKHGGLMIWSLDTDDFDGKFCGKGAFPLVSAAADQFTDPVSIAPVSPIIKESAPRAKETEQHEVFATDNAIKLTSSIPKPLTKDSATRSLSVKLAKARTEDSKVDLKIKSNESNMTTKVVSKTTTESNKTKISTINSAESKNNSVTAVNKSLKKSEIRSKIKDKTSVKLSEGLKIKAKTDKINKNKVLKKTINRNSDTTKVKSRRIPVLTSKKKRPLRGRKRKQWRRRRPSRKGRRRPRKQNVLRRKNAVKKFKPKSQKNVQEKLSSIKTKNATTAKPETSRSSAGKVSLSISEGKKKSR